MTPTAISTNEVLGLLWRVVMLDATAFQELRDEAQLTLIAAGGLVAAVVIAGFGAWLYSHTVLEGGDFSFVKTVLLGSLFTLILFGAGFGITYVALTTLLRIDIAPDALFRLLAAGYLPYALGLLVCIRAWVCLRPAVGDRGLLLVAVRVAGGASGGERAAPGRRGHRRDVSLGGDDPVHLRPRQRVRYRRVRLRIDRVRRQLRTEAVRLNYQQIGTEVRYGDTG